MQKSCEIKGRTTHARPLYTVYIQFTAIEPLHSRGNNCHKLKEIIIFASKLLTLSVLDVLLIIHKLGPGSLSRPVASPPSIAPGASSFTTATSSPLPSVVLLLLSLFTALFAVSPPVALAPPASRALGTRLPSPQKPVYCQKLINGGRRGKDGWRDINVSPL